MTAANDGPVAVNDTATTAEDTAVIVSVLANDTDLDGDALTVSAATAPAHGTARGQRRRDDHLCAGGELPRRGQLQLHGRGQQRRDGDGLGHRDGAAGAGRRR